MTHAYTARERRIAVVYGILCHGAFAIGIAAMIAGIFTGLRLGHGPFSGVAAFGVCAAYAVSWLFLLKTMSDAGMAVQTGFLGWSAVARGRDPRFDGFRVRGTFRFVRQPVYVAFACTLWTGPVWTPDHLLLAVTWTAYCVFGPRLKERRYLGYYGESFSRYRERVPYWLPTWRRVQNEGTEPC